MIGKGIVEESLSGLFRNGTLHFFQIRSNYQFKNCFSYFFQCRYMKMYRNIDNEYRHKI